MNYLVKKTKRLKKINFFINHPINLVIVYKKLVMDQEKNWMLMTYYCPTHGNSGLVKPIQLTKKEISKTFLKKGRSSKN